MIIRISKNNKKFKPVASFIAIFTIIFFIAASMISCTTSKNSSDGSTNNDNQNIEQNENGDIQEETVSSVTGEDLTDYDNVKVGAEIKGAIPGFLTTNKDNYVGVEIKNTSDFTWRNDSKNSVRVGYHYYGQDIDASDYDSTTRTELGKNVAPGETIEVYVLINDIKQPGNYVIQIDLVLEGKYWFSSKDVEMIESPVYFGESKS
ncbi:MAG: hypothetical protein PHR39_08520 [Actinomycetota bacterium]|nr:hypothetical protein [Actinomycetota bacterium]